MGYELNHVLLFTLSSADQGPTARFRARAGILGQLGFWGHLGPKMGFQDDTGVMLTFDREMHASRIHT